MKNLKIFLPLVDGSSLPLDFSSGKDIIHKLISDDFGIPPTSLIFEANTKDGKIFKIVIPYNDEDTVSVISQP